MRKRVSNRLSRKRNTDGERFLTNSLQIYNNSGPAFCYLFIERESDEDFQELDKNGSWIRRQKGR